VTSRLEPGTGDGGATRGVAAAGRTAAVTRFAVRRGWLVWAPVILVVSVVPVAWVFGAAPRDTWSLSGELGHFFEFGLFAALVALSRERAAGLRAALLAGAAAAVAYGAAIELVQWPIPYRSCDPRDLAVDVLGVACACAVVWRLRRRAAAGSAARASSARET
jgi:VanZ family protein